MNYLVTEAGKQIERALEQGYDVAAFNLYRDAIKNDVELVMGEDKTAWHRDIQQRTGWAAESESVARFAEALDAAGEDPEAAYSIELEEPPMPRDTSGRVRGELGEE